MPEVNMPDNRDINTEPEQTDIDEQPAKPEQPSASEGTSERAPGFRCDSHDSLCDSPGHTLYGDGARCVSCNEVVPGSHDVVRCIACDAKIARA